MSALVKKKERMSSPSVQDKRKEISFFDTLGDSREYNVFTNDSNLRLLQALINLSDLAKGKPVVDLGCGSGTFTELLTDAGYNVFGLDISYGLIRMGQRRHPRLGFLVGDVDNLPFSSGSIDGVLLIGLVHHLPKPVQLARELYRVLKQGGKFVAFDPNRRNPFMFLYRDRSSPFYSSKGVTENERPVVAEEIARVFSDVGFRVRSECISGMRYRYVASRFMQRMLPIYHALDSLLFSPEFMKAYRAFVLTSGVKT